MKSVIYQREDTNFPYSSAILPENPNRDKINNFKKRIKSKYCESVWWIYLCQWKDNNLYKSFGEYDLLRRLFIDFVQKNRNNQTLYFFKVWFSAVHEKISEILKILVCLLKNEN